VTTLPISAEGQAVALAASSLALGGPRSSVKPLSATEWHALSRQIHHADLRPRNLLHMSPEEMRERIDIGPDLADRLSMLLSRGGQLAVEVERLSSVGIWVLTRADDSYPAALRRRLGAQAPPVLFGAGRTDALSAPGLAVVGSRNVDDAGLEYAGALGRLCAEQSLSIVSGGARGVDSAAMGGALDRGGVAVGVTVDSLEKLVRKRDYRMSIAEEQLTLVTPFHPATRWYAGNAMRRNRLIYALAQAAIVVASSIERSGTRAGAIEDLESGWVPLHVRDDGTPGNLDLIKSGASPLSPRVSEVEIGELLAARPSVQVEIRPAPPELKAAPEVPEIPPAPDSEEIFHLIWPIIARHLDEPRTERDIARHLGLEPTQARAWLHRAVEEGQADVSDRPKRYVCRPVDAGQLRLIES
jgi:DNA processing protein